MNRDIIRKLIGITLSITLGVIIISASSIFAHNLTAQDIEVVIDLPRPDFHYAEVALATPTPMPTPTPSFVRSDINVMLLGIDDEAALPDTIILAHYNGEANEFNFISIPRDSWIDFTQEEMDGMRAAGRWFPNTHGSKINEFFTHAGSLNGDGIAFMQRRLENMFNIEIDHYVIIRFDGFEAIIDAVGGIYIDVRPGGLHSGPPLEIINIPGGRQLMDGRMALDFVRFRYLRMGDLDRIEHQQQFMREFLAQTITMQNILGNPITFFNTFSTYVRTNVTLFDLNSYFSLIRNFNVDSVEFNTVPSVFGYRHGQSVVIIDLDEIATMLH